MGERTALVLGKGSLAIRVAQWFLDSEEYELLGILPVVPEPGWTDSLIDWARERSVPFVESGDYQDCATDADGCVADLGFSVFYDKILPAETIQRFGRLLNLHNAPLPRYRGVSPINWALRNGETSHGVTIHEIAPGIDDGPIVGQLEYSIYPDIDEVIDVYHRALEYGWTLFDQTMPLLDGIEPRPQDASLATYFGAGDHRRLGDRASFTRALSVGS